MSENKKRKAKGRKGIVKKIFLWLVILVVLAGAGLYGYSKLRAEYTITYDTYTASIGSISNSLSFSGSMQLIDSAVYTASSESTVRTLYVKAGDDVKDGDKLVRLANGETITADFDGRVNVVYVEKDDKVTAGTQLVQIADFSHMQVSVRVDEYDINNVHVGDECIVTTTATERQFSSKIDTINYISSSQGNVAYYTAVVKVDVGEGIYPGMQTTVTVPMESAENVVVLKMDALSFDRTNSAFVYKQNAAGEMEQSPVTVGVSNGNYVEISSGVADGETVYAVAKVKTADPFAAMMSGTFGGTQINNQRRNNYGNYGNGSNGRSNNGGSYGGGMPGGPGGF